MRFLLRMWAMVVIAARRLLSQAGLAVATVVGLVVAVAIVMSIPLYTDAVYYQILQKELSRSGEEGMKRPPFAFMFRYLGALDGLVKLDDLEQVNAYLTGLGVDTLGLPLRWMTRYVRTDNFRFFPASEAAYASVKDPLAWVTFAFISDAESKMTLIEGSFPAVAASDPGAPVEVLVHTRLAQKTGLQVGEEYLVYRAVTQGEGKRVIQFPVRIAGIWRMTDPADEFWFYQESVFEEQLLVPEGTFLTRLGPVLEDGIAQGLWYLVMDGAAITTDDVGRLIRRIQAVQQRALALRPGTRLEFSPLEALQRYWRSSRVLNLLLYAFSTPIIGLLLAFIIVVVGLAVERQRNEIAVLRSRGATVLQVLGIAVVEALILGATALFVGFLVSQQIARLIGSTRSFLDFTIASDLRVVVTRTTLRFGVAAILIALVAQLLPSIGAARHTIITYKQMRARTLRPPWWQRAWLDVLLLIPAAYGAYLLRRQGSIATPATGLLSGGPFDNPLLFLVPALATLALTLLLLRVLPRLMAGLAWLAAQTDSVGFLLASRYLSRDPGFYTAPLVLLILTLSLSIFTASLALTLDTHLADQNYYQVGADVNLAEFGVFNDASATSPAFGAGGAAPAATPEAAAPAASAAEESTIPEAKWVFVPVDEHLKVPGVLAATRVGKYQARIQLQDEMQDAMFVGIDRIGFPKASYWRRDFAPASLGALMNALAVAPNGVLLPRSLMRQNAIRVGDPIQVRVSTYTYNAEMSLKVVGEIDFFPTWYPETEDGPIIVGNLDYLFEQFGGQVPYDVWVKTTPGIDYNQMVDELGKLDLRILGYQAARVVISEQQRLPSRQGLFGVLSVGFLASALLTVLGFLLYALFSFRRRFIELGTLRAVGLSPGQMTAFLAWELTFLIALGIAAGTLLGAFVSQIFLPYLQVGVDPSDLVPPFQVAIAWSAVYRIYVLFGLLFAVALGALAILLMRMKIFQAIKLGETV